MSPRVLTQPPPDPVVEREALPGYHWEWITDEDDRLATEDERETRKCRRPGCQRKPVWALLRPRYTRYSGLPRQWWLYCDWHTYGRKITPDGVLHRRLVPDESDARTDA